MVFFSENLKKHGFLNKKVPEPGYHDECDDKIKAEEGMICSTLDQAGVKAIYPSSSCNAVYENN